MHCLMLFKHGQVGWYLNKLNTCRVTGVWDYAWGSKASSSPVFAIEIRAQYHSLSLLQSSELLQVTSRATT